MTAGRRPASDDPRCEVCGKEPARSFSWFADRERWYEPRSGVWRFTGYCTADTEHYYIMMHGAAGRGHGFLDSAAAREDWLAHLGEKRWFNSADFFAMLARFDRARRRMRGKARYPQRLRVNVKPPLKRELRAIPWTDAERTDS